MTPGIGGLLSTRVAELHREAPFGLERRPPCNRRGSASLGRTYTGMKRMAERRLGPRGLSRHGEVRSEGVRPRDRRRTGDARVRQCAGGAADAGGEKAGYYELSSSSRSSNTKYASAERKVSQALSARSVNCFNCFNCVTGMGKAFRFVRIS